MSDLQRELLDAYSKIVNITYPYWIEHGAPLPPEVEALPDEQPEPEPPGVSAAPPTEAAPATPEPVGAYRKEIVYNRETRDYAMYLGGELVGFARTYHEAEVTLDQLVFELMSGSYFREAA